MYSERDCFITKILSASPPSFTTTGKRIETKREEKSAASVTMTLLPQATGNSTQGEYFPSLSVKGLSNLLKSSYEHYKNTIQWPRKGKIPQLVLNSPCFGESQ